MTGIPRAYEQVESFLKEKIERGEWPAGSPVPSERALAAQFDFCRVTVGRALKSLESEGLLVSRRGVGRFVREPEGASRTRRIGIAIFSLHHLDSFVISEVVRGAQEAALSRGWQAVLYAATLQGEGPRVGLADLVPKGWIDGLIVAQQEAGDQELRLLAQEMPLVGYNLSAEPEEVSLVSARYDEGSREAIHHLTARGHRRIALLNGRSEFRIARDYEDGYRTGLAEAGIAYDPALVAYGPYQLEFGWASLKSLLRTPSPPTAALCGDDMIAFGALQAAQAAGRRVPDDFAVVGCNDMPLARLVTPSLTTLGIPFFRIGVDLAALLLDRLEGRLRDYRKPISHCPLLVVRQST
ncbi:MAG: GntR family transcriptional regulator [Armatimonadetes bacterium]|nr:GntR family transcriptional regulator [Armatimonadota bacterium]